MIYKYILILFINILVSDIIYYYPQGLKENGEKTFEDVTYSPERSTPYLIAYKEKFIPFRQMKIKNYERINCEEVIVVKDDNGDEIKTKCNKLWTPPLNIIKPYKYISSKSNNVNQGPIKNLLIFIGLIFFYASCI